MKQYLNIRINLIFLWIIISLSGTSQSWQWAKQIGSYDQDWGLGTCDMEGNFYIAGSYQGDPCHFSDTSLNLNGKYSGMFIAKYSNTGQELWVKKIGYGYSDQEVSGFGDILVDNNGFLYITGEFFRIAVFDTIFLYSVYNSGDMFLAKYAPDGTCLWAKSAGGTGNDGGSGLAIDSEGNVYVCGSNLGSANFDKISIIRGGFIAKYDSSGHCLWAKNKSKYNNPFFGSDLCYTAMTIYKDNLYTCGYMMSDTILIDTILIAHPKNTGGNIVCCYDLDANIKWVGESTSAATSGENISTDKDGNVYATGQFWKSIDFKGVVLDNLGRQDAFFCKYTPHGSLVWAKQLQATINASGNSIIPDSEGNCYTTGWFQGTAKFGNDSIISDSYKDLFLAKYDGEGNFIGVTHFGEAEGVLLSLDNEDNPYFTGVFKNEVTIGKNILTSYGDQDIFIAKIDKISGMRESGANDKNQQLIIYANPTTGKCNITIPEEFLHEKSLMLTLYDIQGKIVQSFTVVLSENKISLNLSAQASGIYNAVLTNGKKSYTGRIVLCQN